MFQNAIEIAVAIAAPSIPYLGINKRFRTIFIMQPVIKKLTACFWWPDMLISKPTEPDITLRIAPMARITIAL